MASEKIQTFVGVDALVQWVSTLALQTTSVHHNTELNRIAEELYLLDKSLKRLRFDRNLVDDCDVDRLIDTLRCRKDG